MSEQAHWMQNNQQHLSAIVEWIALRLQRLVNICEGKDETASDVEQIEQLFQRVQDLENRQLPPALNLLGNALGLSNFERQVLALCIAVELNTQISELCARAQADPARPFPTFALAFVLFDDPDWNVLSPHAPLRYWRVLEIKQSGSRALTGAALAVDERIVNYIKGLNYLDERLTPFVSPVQWGPIANQHYDETLPDSQQHNVDAIIESLQYANGSGVPPVIELLGHDPGSKRLIASNVASTLGLSLQTLELKTLPNQLGELETLTRLWQRERLLLPLALVIDIKGANETEKTLLRRFLQRDSGVIFLDADEAGIELCHSRFTIEINKPTPLEQQQLWTEGLQECADDNPQRLAQQFSFNQSEIKRLSTIVLDKSSRDTQLLKPQLWQACRVAARTGLDQLARRIDSRANWEQLVLPPLQTALLQQITDQVACRDTVYESWGFRQQMNRGLGINALFAGESGTGKTMAAEVVANALQLDLYRIDLSGVINKYIGETEKNLRRLFDAAEDSGAILFFDEADALFGKRSAVKDSHDRYANIEINYLLQRMESYRGLAILATNMKTSLDKAFIRRLRFIVDFPFPGIEERTAIWQRAFPPETPINQEVNYRALAKLRLTGGNIHNVALNAAFLAARQNSPVTMTHILDAARNEYKKLERPAKESDFTWQSNLEVAI